MEKLTEKQLTGISKFLSFVLRHQPESIGIELDKNGWTDVEKLIMQASANGTHFDLDILKHIVATNAKKRFAFDDTGNKIRASQGHSVDIDPGYTAQEPPEILFHGTGEKSVAAILETGIGKQGRLHVHLSSDPDTAVKVGQRHGRPFVFEVLSGKMHQEGFSFFISENGVWLTDHVPAIYLKKK